MRHGGQPILIPVSLVICLNLKTYLRHSWANLDSNALHIGEQIDVIKLLRKLYIHYTSGGSFRALKKLYIHYTSGGSFRALKKKVANVPRLLRHAYVS